MKLSQAAQVLQVKAPILDTEFQGISTDTRTLQVGELFIAISGPMFDGHDFIAQAAQKNAAAIIVEHPCSSSLPCLVVENTIHALGQLAAFHRSQFTIPVVGITGSCGKTTTRALIANILSAHSETLSSEGSFNNEIGVPLTLLRLQAQHQYAIIEMGANHLGEIAYLTHLVKPHVALITNAADAHLEGFGTIAGVRQAKGEIFAGLSADGIGILNADDPNLTSWESLVAPRKILRFSLVTPTDIHAKHITIDAHGKALFTLVTPEDETSVCLPLLGLHNVANALAATATAYALNIPLATIKAGLQQTVAVAKRLNQQTSPRGVHIIDDTYNANPLSVAAAIHILAQCPGERILVLGDMQELGDEAANAHRSVGEKARQAGIEHFYTYGETSALATQAFGKKAQHFTDQASLIATLSLPLPQPTTVLVKGSRSMKMERVVEALMNLKS